MRETITGLVIGTIVKAAKVTATVAGNYGAYVDLSTMQAGDEVAFWLEYDIGGDDAPVVAGPVHSISYEDLV